MNTTDALDSELQTNSQGRGGGPKSDEGKERSKRNALKLGLRSKIIFPDDLAEIIDQRVGDLTEQFSPTNPYEEMLIRDMAVASARFERCASLTTADLVRVAERAASCWEVDRRAAVENAAAKLSKDPARIAAALRRSYQGVDWLLDRWDLLASIARSSGRWDDDQRTLAFDLLGVPHELRKGNPQIADGDDPAPLIALADEQIELLLDAQSSALEDLNDAEQSMTVAGMPLEEDATTARLRKSEGRARTDFAKALKELLRVRSEPASPSPARPASTKVDRAPLSKAASDSLVKHSHIPTSFIAFPESDLLPSYHSSSTPFASAGHPS